MTSAFVAEWLDNNPGWYVSRELWWSCGAQGLGMTFHKFRRRVQSLVEKRQVMRRIKHAHFGVAAADGEKWSYNGPVYEYRRQVNPT